MFPLQVFKKQVNMKHCLLFFLISFSLITLNSCKKEISNSTDTSIELNARKIQYAPFEIMEIQTSSFLFTGDSLLANIGDTTLTMYTDSAGATVLLPRLNDGTHELRFNINDKRYSVRFQVKALTNLGTPQQYWQTATQQFNTQISILRQQRDSLLADGVPASELSALNQDITNYTQLIQQKQAEFNQLSNGEKADFVEFMEVNKPLLDSLRQLNGPLLASVNTLRITQQVENYESNVNAAEIRFVKKVIRTVAHIPLLKVCFQLAALPVPNPLFKAGAGLAAFVLTTDFVLDAMNTAALGKQLVKKRIKPFLVNNPTVSGFLNNQETSVNIQGNYRNIIDSDPNARIQSNENGPVIQRIADNYSAFKRSYDFLMGLIPSLLRPSFRVAPLPTTVETEARSIFNEYIVVNNSTNPNVSITQLNQPDGSIKLKASTTLTGTQNFSYDINYVNANFTTNLKKTVNATVTNGSSCPGALGAYWVKNFFIANPGGYESAEMILLPDGVMKYKLQSESTYRTYAYTLSGCLVSFDMFGCMNDWFFYVSGQTSFSVSNSCSNIYRNHVFVKQ
jgi:hypothetical protein